MKVVRLVAVAAMVLTAMVFDPGVADAGTTCYYSSASGSASTAATITVSGTAYTARVEATKFKGSGCSSRDWLAPAGSVVVSGVLYRVTSTGTTECRTLGPVKNSLTSLGYAYATTTWTVGNRPCGSGQYYVASRASVVVNGVSRGGGTTSNMV